MWGIIATWEFALAGVSAASQILENHGDIFSSITTTCKMAEDDITVSSVGYGGLPNEEGDMELDAAIMDGKTLSIGAVAGVRHHRNPTLIARAVMEHCRHTFLIGEGADKFADKMGIPRESVLTEEARRKWEELMRAREEGIIGHDTIGVVALGSDGHMAAGTSTSGAGLKMCGRVGDSPLVGCGYYADDACGGAAATGLGEDIMKSCVCFYATELMRAGVAAQEAAERAVARGHERLAAGGANPGNIAIVCIDKSGRFGGAANHEGFVYAAATAACAPKLYEVQPLVLRKSSNTELERINNIAPLSK